MDLSSCTALVTGAGSGLGEIIADHLADGGASVLVVDVDRTAAQLTADRIGGQAITADVSTPISRAHLVSTVQQDHRPLVLVNNAGGWGPSERQYPESTEIEWRSVLELNLLAPMALTQALLETGQLKSVVNISSSAARGPVNYGSPEYAVSKAGVIRLTTALTGNTYGVRMNCIVPGWIGLPRAIAELSSRPLEDRTELVDPHDIAREVVRLAAGDDLDGQVIIMDR